MTDRLNALTVSLDRDIREDDAEVIINAIKAIRGVNGVTANKDGSISKDYILFGSVNGDDILPVKITNGTS